LLYSHVHIGRPLADKFPLKNQFEPSVRAEENLGPDEEVMSGPESNRRRDLTASANTDDVSEAVAVSSVGKAIAGSSEQYQTKAETEKAFDELKRSEHKFRVMVDTIRAGVVHSARWFQ